LAGTLAGAEANSTYQLEAFMEAVQRVVETGFVKASSTATSGPARVQWMAIVQRRGRTDIVIDRAN
jgi:hypothetical protein